MLQVKATIRHLENRDDFFNGAFDCQLQAITALFEYFLGEKGEAWNQILSRARNLLQLMRRQHTQKRYSKEDSVKDFSIRDVRAVRRDIRELKGYERHMEARFRLARRKIESRSDCIY